MKRNILIIFIILTFVTATFGKPPNRRAHDNIYEKFIIKKLALLGLKAGKINKIGIDYIVIINTYSPKIKALRRTKPFRSFTLKVKLQGKMPDLNTKMGIVVIDRNIKKVKSQGTKPDSNTKMGLVMEEKKLKSQGTKPDSNTKMGVVMEEKKLKLLNKNLKLLIKKGTLLGANFIVDDNGMPAGIILH